MKVETIGQRIRFLRLKHNMTQKNLAAALHVSESTVSYWECGKTEPSIMFIIQLVVLFQTSLNYLIIGNENTTL